MEWKNEIANITDLNRFNFKSYNKKLLQVWKHDGIGNGKFLELKKFNGLPEAKFIYKLKSGDIRHTTLAFKKSGTTETVQTRPGDCEDEAANPNQNDCTFACPSDTCDLKFKRYQNLQYHLLSKACSRTRKEAGMAYAARTYAEAFSDSSYEAFTRQERRSRPIHLEELRRIELLPEIPKGEIQFLHEYQMGFALKTRKAATQFTSKQINFIKKIYQEGEQSSAKKKQPIQIKVLMRQAVNLSTNAAIFEPHEWLEEQQIKYIIAKFIAEKKKAGLAGMEIEDDAIVDEVVEAMAANADAGVSRVICNALQITEPPKEQDHPIIVSYSPQLEIVHCVIMYFLSG